MPTRIDRIIDEEDRRRLKMTDFHELLVRYRAESLSEAEKGAKFERLMRAYLLTIVLFLPLCGVSTALTVISSRL